MGRAGSQQTDPRWRLRAACRGLDPGLFFPEWGQQTTAFVKKTCGGCPVKRECDIEADRPISLVTDASGQAHMFRVMGSWAGLTEKERRRRRQDAKQPTSSS